MYLYYEICSDCVSPKFDDYTIVFVLVMPSI